MLQQALLFHQNGRLGEAEALYRKILARNPNHAGVLNLLCVIELQRQNLRAAINLIDRAIEIDPNDGAFFCNRGVTLQHLKRYDDALASYDQAIALKPGYADAFYNRGIALQELKRLDEALASYDQAIAFNPGYSVAFYNRGNALQDLKRYDDALASYDRALAIKPDNPEVLNNRGNALRELKRFDDALASYDRALAIQPNYAEALNNRGNALRDLKRFDDALSSYDRALAITPDHVEAWTNRGSALQELERYDEALASFDRVIALSSGHAAAYRNRGVALHLLKRHRDAVASYEKAIALKPDYAQAYNNLANVLAEQGKFDEAVACYQRALGVKLDYVEVHVNLGNVLKNQGKLDDAILHYQQALAILPRQVDAHLNLGYVFLEQGRLNDALLAAEAVALLDDEPSFPHFALGVLLARCNRNDDAHRYLLKYLEQDVDDCRGARLILAGLGFGALPERASESLLRRLYAGRADRWDRVDPMYNGHELVARAIKGLCTDAAGLDILDAGCGTGRVGGLVRYIARRLDGVDVTPEMVEKAMQNGSYDGLYEGDLVEFLATHPAAYDVIVSAATLIHFGDLKPVFRAAATSLRGKGLFVLTLFPNDNEQSNREVTAAPLGGLGEGGCYVHSRGYVTRVAEETGFTVALMETDVHEYDNWGRPIHALIVALRRNVARSPLQPHRGVGDRAAS